MGYLMALPITSNIHTIRISKKVTATPARKKLWNSFNIKWKLFHFIHYQRISLPPSSQEIATTQMCFRSSFPGGPLKSLCFLQKTSNILSFFPYIQGKHFNFSVHRNGFTNLFSQEIFLMETSYMDFLLPKVWFWICFFEWLVLRDSTMGIHHHFVTTIWETIFSGNFFNASYFFAKIRHQWGLLTCIFPSLHTGILGLVVPRLRP